jgi:hypothetical protein
METFDSRARHKLMAASISSGDFGFKSASSRAPVSGLKHMKIN